MLSAALWHGRQDGLNIWLIRSTAGWPACEFRARHAAYFNRLDRVNRVPRDTKALGHEESRKTVAPVRYRQALIILFPTIDTIYWED